MWNSRWLEEMTENKSKRDTGGTRVGRFCDSEMAVKDGREFRYEDTDVEFS